MTGLAITGYPSTWRSPFVAAEVLLGQGPSTAGAAEWEALVVGPKSSAGTATVDTVYPITSEQDAITLAGPGSPVHRGIRTRLQLSKTGPLNILCYAESSGAGVATATTTITVTLDGSNPTGTGTLKLLICEVPIDLVYTTSSTATTIGDDIEAKINAQAHLPMTAANVTGTVTLTAKVAGDSQNTIYRVRVIGYTAGTGVTSVVAAASTLGAGADGAVTENANLTTALASIEAVRYAYMAITSPVSADVVTAATHVVTKSQPNPGLRSRLYFGNVGALSALATIAIGRNSERVAACWQLNSDHCPAQLAAALMTAHQREEAVEVATGFDGYSPQTWPIRPAYSQADWPTADDIEDAVTDGIVAIASNQTTSYIAMSVTTRSKDSTGLLDDFRATEPHRVAVMDHLADTLVYRDRLTWANFKLRDDLYLADGTLDVNAQFPPRTLTPSIHKSWMLDIVVGTYIDERGWLQVASDWEDSAIDIIDPENSSRLQIALSGRVVDLHHQTTYRLAETTSN